LQRLPERLLKMSGHSRGKEEKSRDEGPMRVRELSDAVMEVGRTQRSRKKRGQRNKRWMIMIMITICMASRGIARRWSEVKR
jgi:hypothetical protein